MASVPSSPPAFLPSLAQYLEASQKRFERCFSTLDEQVSLDSVEADITLHFVSFDPTTKQPKFDLLVKAMIKHVVCYSMSARTRQQMELQPDYDAEDGELYRLARDYFRKLEDSGEVGELLLFFLLEAAIGAPQVVCKMELKTNAADEVKGADGIHVKWDLESQHLDVFIGEAKLYQDIGGAMTDAMDSIARLYTEDRLDAELQLVTSHFKHLDVDFQQRVMAWTNRESAEHDCHIIHSCLIGFDWPEYKRLATDRDKFFAEFESQYRKYCKNIKSLLDSRFSAYAHCHLSFHFLFIPFASVQDFRLAFYKELLGTGLHPKPPKAPKPPTKGVTGG